MKSDFARSIVSPPPEVRDSVTVAVVNFHPVWGKNNIRRIREFAESAAGSGAGIIVFPEMALTGYDPDPAEAGEKRMQLRLAETVPGLSCEALKPVAAHYGAYIVFGLPERDGDRVYNSVAVICPEGRVLSYRKLHPFGRENTWCIRGETPLLVTTPWGPVGIGICYDSYQFPELVRYYAARGARLYINCTAQCANMQHEDGRTRFEHYYLTTLAGHVVANEIFVASSNLAGLDNTTRFPGASMILGPGVRRQAGQEDPYYRIYAGDIADCREEIIAATLDLSLAERTLYRDNPFTGVPDFRPELYARLYRELAAVQAGQ